LLRPMSSMPVEGISMACKDEGCLYREENKGTFYGNNPKPRQGFYCCQNPASLHSVTAPKGSERCCSA